MAKFVPLPQSPGGLIYVNADSVRYVSQHSDDGSTKLTRITFAKDDSILVEGDAAEVARNLAT